MTVVQTPSEWAERDDKHPSDGIVSNAYRWFQHRDGAELVIWSDVEEDGRDYEVETGPVYAVELSYPDGHLHSGYAFDGREDAEQKTQRMMEKCQGDDQ